MEEYVLCINLKAVFSYLLILSVFFNVYGIGSVGFGEALLMFFMLGSVFKLKIPFSKLYIFLALYILYFIVIAIGTSFVIYDNSLGDVFFRNLRIIFYMVLIFIWARQFFSFYHAMKILNLLAVMASVLIVVQFFSFFILGHYISGLIPFLPIYGNDLDDYYSIALNYNNTIGFVRPQSFFTEPAHCAYFIGLVLLINTIPFRFSKLKTSNKLIALLVLALMLTASVSSYACLCFILLLWFMNKKVGTIKDLFKVLKVVCIISLLITVFYIMFPTVVSAVMGRFFNIDINTANSVGIRLFKGPLLWFDLPLIFKCIGIGFGNLSIIQDYYNIHTIFDVSPRFVATIWFHLISVGFIGVAMIVTMIRKLLKGKEYTNKAILCLSVFFGIYETLHYNMSWVLYLVFAFYADDSHC